MGLISGLALYFIIWWTVLFTVLPWFIHREEKTQKGNDPGAPANPRIKEKMLVTTVISFIFWLFIYAMLEYDIISLDLVR